MITILQSVEQANTLAKMPDFTFAAIDEFARFIDSFKQTDVPIHVITPFEERGTWDGARRKAILPIEGWVLTPLREETVDYRSRRVEEVYISPMRVKCKTFLRFLTETDMVDDEIRQIKDIITPEYGHLSARLFGVHYRIELPIVQGVC